MPGNFGTLPIWQIATWPEPNNVDPVRRTWLPGYAIALQIISTILVATRLWLRGTKQAGVLGLDDLLLIPTWLSSVAFTACCIVFMNYGGDRHVWDIPKEYFAPAIKNAWVAEMVYLISTTCVKVSVLLFYRRLVAGTYSRRWKYATIFAIFFTVGYCVSFIFVLIFGCQPTYAYWTSFDLDWLIENGNNYYCIDGAKANLIAGLLSVFSDFYAVLLPCLMLRRFDAPRKQKIALNVVFSFGLLVVAAGAVRTYYFNQLAYTLDETWVGYDVFVWAILELQLAIICASAPALRVFFRKYLSDPLHKVVNTAKATSSAITRSGHRHSTVSHGVVQFPSNHSRNMSDVKSAQPFSPVDEYAELKNSSRPYHTTVSEKEDFSAPQMSEKSPAIRTPADFENFALENLEKNRPFPKPAYIRPMSDSSNYEHAPHAYPHPPQ